MFMDRIILHVDFNSYFATVEQQANPRLRGKPVGVTGGDRMERTVLGAASVEAKERGVKTGMRIPEALKLCPNLILVKGDSDKYLECTKRFINILKDYSPNVEVFSIDEVFLEINPKHEARISKQIQNINFQSLKHSNLGFNDCFGFRIAEEIKFRIKSEVGEWITCSIGISYNKLMAKFAGSLQKPDGLVGILDQEAAIRLLDQAELDDICGIGGRLKARLNNMGIFSFKQLREVPLFNLVASFKGHQGQILYNMARALDFSEVVPFYEKEEVKSVGHRLTIDHDTDDPNKIKQVLLKLSELVGRRLRAKKLVGKTISLWYRLAYSSGVASVHLEGVFAGDGRQVTIGFTDDGLEIFKAGWKLFLSLWEGGPSTERSGPAAIRMIGISVSNVKPKNPENLTFLEDALRQEKIVSTLDRINDRYGEFTLQRGVLLRSHKIRRMPNPFLSDRRFKL